MSVINCISHSHKKKNLIFRNAYFDLKRQKTQKKKILVSECDILHITLLARCQIWQNSPKTKKNAPQEAFNQEIMCDKY